MNREELRTEWETMSKEKIEVTQSDVYRIVKIEEEQEDGTLVEVEGSWAEWGYVIYLENRLIKSFEEIAHLTSENGDLYLEMICSRRKLEKVITLAEEWSRGRWSGEYGVAMRRCLEAIKNIFGSSQKDP